MGELKVGIAKVDISPEENCMPAMGMLPGQIYTEIHHRIYIRCMILDNDEQKVVMIAQELLRAFCVDEIKNYLEKRYNIDPKFVFVCGTHTHEAPNLAGIPKEYGGTESSGEWGEKYKNQLIRAMKKACDHAMESRRKAKIGFGEGKSYINVCRDKQYENHVWGEGINFAGPSDKTLAIIKITDENNNIMGGILNYACHGVSCFLEPDAEGKSEISGDIPGMVSTYLEERYQKEEAVFLWMPGAEGNQNPIFKASYKHFQHNGMAVEKYKIGNDIWKMALSLAEEQGVDAVQILENIKDCSEKVKFWSAYRKMSVPGRNIIFEANNFNEILQMRNGSMPFRGKECDAEPVELILHLLRINDMALFWANGEIVSEIGMRLKKIAPLRKLIIVTNIEGNAGYIPDIEGYQKRTFEYFGSKIKGGQGEKYLQQGLLEMFREVMNT